MDETANIYGWLFDMSSIASVDKRKDRTQTLSKLITTFTPDDFERSKALQQKELLNPLNSDTMFNAMVYVLDRKSVV